MRISTRLALLLATLATACGDLDEYPRAECTRGELGCECAPRNTCKKGPDGQQLVCVDGSCDLPVCTQPGQPGCRCGGANVCQAGHVCVDDVCVPDTGQTLMPPKEPVCYTPCKGDLVRPDGTVVRCSKDGLLEGCVDGAVCRNGTCVVPFGVASQEGELRQGLEDEPGACRSDVDCPDFQSCIQGRCYSDCTRDEECRGERVCYRNTCRLPCSVATDSCPAGTVCTTVDGEAGYCLPLAPGNGATEEPVEGTFTVSASILEFTARNTTGSFTIANDGPVALTFTVRKVRHREFTDRGPVTIVENPLFWIEMAVGPDEPERTQELSVEIPPQGTREIRLAEVDNPLLNRWEGTIEVSHPQLGIRNVNLSFARSPEGRWSGSMYYFGNFSDAGLEAWRKNKNSTDALRAVSNAFIRRWGALRNRRISYDEFRAAVTAMQTESWKWESVKQRCPREGAPDPNVGCYLYDNTQGIAIFSDYLPDNPIPTGVVDMPIVLDLGQTRGGSPREWVGKILSAETLHYAGDPHIEVRFAADPSSCSDSFGQTCVNLLEEFRAEVLVGGRFKVPPTSTSCGDAQGFKVFRTPWLVPGFEGDAALDVTDNRLYVYECRDTLLPFGKGEEELNASMAASNPIPDGATRRRIIELVDGALIDQKTLFVIFREHQPSFLDPWDAEGFSSYGYMVLEYQRGVQLNPEELQGLEHVDYRNPPSVPGVGCSEELLAEIGAHIPGQPTQLTPDNASAFGLGVVNGVVPTSEPPPILDETSEEQVHYLCVDTGYFDGGPGDDGSPNAEKLPCPRGSRVEFFTVKGMTQKDIAQLACQTNPGICNAGEPCEFDIRKGGECKTGCDPQDPHCDPSVCLDEEYEALVSGGCKVGELCEKKGRCGEQLARWKTQPGKVRTNVVWRCEDENRQSCDDDRGDLRVGKIFYGEAPDGSSSGVVFRSLADEIFDAFRYKTRFRTRAGRSIGFAPEICVGDSVPYCYDPVAIERIQQRADCAAHIYTQYHDHLSNEARSTLQDFLSWSFSYREERVPGLAAPVVHDGFEKLNAELLIMLGDESFTAAFSSRFDLAGQRLADFQGELFEPSGINLSGGAGFEMYSLYQAAQYYQLALDRFYKQASVIWASLSNPDRSFIGQATTTSYFDKLIRASAQKTRVYSEIAKRYQSFNRPDLARRVIERAYSQAYMESAVLTQMMRRLSQSATTSVEQITRAIELAQATYRMALLDMRNVYKDISDAQTFYGIAPDYIPFPALDPGDPNAFVKAMSRAREVARTAAEKEQRALSETRSFDTDSALFQAELARIRDEAEGRLGEICGTFTVAEEGEVAVYPAIPKYAHLTEKTRLLGDPCGLVGNGELHDAIRELEIARLDFEGMRQEYRNLLMAAADLEARAKAQCARIERLADFMFETDTEILSLNDGIRSLELIIETTSDLVDGMANLLDATNCETFGCIRAATSGVAFSVSFAIAMGVKTTNRAIIVGLQSKIDRLERAKAQREILEECEALQIDTVFEVRDLLREAALLELEVAKLQYGVQLALSQIERLRNEALSTMAGQAESEQMAINIEAARNDPNVRIYRNDAVTAADRTFHAALREAYRATKVFEYYTSQSYAALEKLFLTRMVSAGDFTLEAYLDDLERAFVEFQEQYGNPDLRVAIVSLRDDILRIPMIDESGLALSEARRTELLRERLRDVNLLDGRGYLLMPFATSIDDLSPLTRNHKVRFVEVEIVGDRVGDSLGRVYLTQRGTGVVRTVAGDNAYYSFPVRTAVLNPFFNGTRPLAPEIYRSERLRDRPFVNTGWELVFNQKDEKVNRDIDLGSLKDIRLYIYYTDFTEL